MKDFMEDAIYPLTIVADRYSGTYSGGEYIAWNKHWWDVPEDTFGGDIDCMLFWKKNKIVCGKGRTVSEALSNLYFKLRAKEGEQNGI